MDHENIGIAVVIESLVSKKILLVEEENSSSGSNKNQGDLSLVVGHVKNGETPLEAATREIEEETGIKGLIPGNLFKIFYFKKGHVVFMFSCSVESEENKIGSWYSLGEIKRLTNLRPGISDAIREFENSVSISPDIIFTN